jgi:heat shock protein HspQ
MADKYDPKIHHRHSIRLPWYDYSQDDRNLWQRNYYEHIIRNEDELNHTHQYIAENPINCRKDEENPNLQSPTIYSNTARTI